jgi:hypothetical protein
MTEPYRIRSPETWAQARDDYLSGLDAETVCRRHDLGLSAFRRRAREQGWRRLDHDEPPSRDRDPGADLDLSIYDDVGIDEQIVMAARRFTRALSHGRAVEAGRWRRLHRALCAERAALDADLFPGEGRDRIADRLAADLAEADESEAGVRRLSARLRQVLPAPRPAALAAPAAGNVHDVHSLFSSAHCPADAAPPQGRAERRRALREARRRPA